MSAGKETDPLLEGGIRPGPSPSRLALLAVLPAAINFMVSPPFCPMAKNTTLFALVRSKASGSLNVIPATPRGPGVY